MIVGRVTVSALAVRFRPAPMILLLSVGSAVASAAVAVSPSTSACLAASAVAGLFMAGLFGLVLTDAARHFPQHSGAVFGLLTAVSAASPEPLRLAILPGEGERAPGEEVIAQLEVALTQERQQALWVVAGPQGV